MKQRKTGGFQHQIQSSRCQLGLLEARTLLLLSLLLLSLLSMWSQQAEAAVHSSFRRLSSREKKEMQKEILSILGLPGRPRPHPPLRPPSSAPLFMLDLYHAMATDGEDEASEIAGNGPGFGAGQWLTQVSYAAPPTLSTHTPPLGTMVSEADTVMSFVNLGELNSHPTGGRWVGGSRRSRSRIPDGGQSGESLNDRLDRPHFSFFPFFLSYVGIWMKASKPPSSLMDVYL